MTPLEIEQVIQKNREEARLKVRASLQARFPGKIRTIPALLEKEEPKEQPKEKPSVRDNSALVKVARKYRGEILGSIQDIASDILRKSRELNSFDTTTDNDGNVLIYPDNCKLLVKDFDSGTTDGPGWGMLVVEERPQLRTVLVQEHYEVKSYQIAMPYMVYLIGFNSSSKDGNTIYAYTDMGIGFGKKPIDSIDNQLFTPSLPHVTGNRAICQEVPYKVYKTIKELSDGCVEAFWSTPFHYTFDQAGCMFSLEDGTRIDSFSSWQSNIKNPLDILKARFSRGDSVRRLMAYFTRYASNHGPGGAKDRTQKKIDAAVAQLVLKMTESFSEETLMQLLQKTVNDSESA